MTTDKNDLSLPETFGEETLVAIQDRVDGARKTSGGKSRNRVVMTMGVFLMIYGAIAGRLV